MSADAFAYKKYNYMQSTLAKTPLLEMPENGGTKNGGIYWESHLTYNKKHIIILDLKINGGIREEGLTEGQYWRGRGVD